MNHHRAPIFLPVAAFILIALAIATGPVGWLLLVMATGPLLIFFLLGGVVHSHRDDPEYRHDGVPGHRV
jgi:hypothetical protein